MVQVTDTVTHEDSATASDSSPPLDSLPVMSPGLLIRKHQENPVFTLLTFSYFLVRMSKRDKNAISPSRLVLAGVSAWPADQKSRPLSTLTQKSICYEGVPSKVNSFQR